VGQRRTIAGRCGGENTNLAVGGIGFQIPCRTHHFACDGSHEAALRWLNATFPTATHDSQYRDRRMACVWLTFTGLASGVAKHQTASIPTQTPHKIATVQRPPID